MANAMANGMANGMANVTGSGHPLHIFWSLRRETSQLSVVGSQELTTASQQENAQPPHRYRHRDHAEKNIWTNNIDRTAAKLNRTETATTDYRQDYRQLSPAINLPQKN
ncbi:hypothetical protein ACMFMF_011673 [Clarireedia jacksonii]